MMPTTITILQGDCREVLATLPAESVNCCVTSPPYYALRDYGVAGQIGMEPTLQEYLDTMVGVFREVWRVLRPDGTCWVNMGDTYASGGDRGGQGAGGKMADRAVVAARTGRGGRLASPKHASAEASAFCGPNQFPQDGIKPKDIMGVPWRVAFALQADGWYLRQDIIWHKPNPMPESVTDRCTKAHEYVFLLSKSERYYYDADAIAEPADPKYESRYDAPFNNGTKEANGAGRPGNAANTAGMLTYTGTRNRRSVWTVPTAPFKGSHFATFPPDLIRPMIRAGCPQGGTVLDPFGGSGTTGMVAEQEGRNAVLIELNPAYIEMQKQRTAQGGLGI